MISKTSGPLAAAWVIVCSLTVLAVVPYLWSLQLPLISDDYWVIGMSRDFGPVSGWPKLLGDPLYRSRATSMIVTWCLYDRFGLNPMVYNLSGVVLHVLNTWLIFAFGSISLIGWRLAAIAAAFFAVYEGHQEAVVWFSALPELLVFFFGMGSLLLWYGWLRGRTVLYPLALASYVLALLSKESAVVFLPLLFVLALGRRPLLRAALGILPFAMLTVGYILLVFQGQQQNQHFHDGTFDLSAPFWLTIAHSVARMFWFWGLLSVLALVAWRPRHWWLWLALPTGWMMLTLLPYSFLTYMARVPSRHTYLASAGLSLLVAAAFIHLRLHLRNRLWVKTVLGLVLIGHNSIYLWTYKQQQYRDRGAPTQALIEMARDAQGPIFVEQFPYPRPVAEHSVELMTGRSRDLLIFEEADRERALYVYSWESSGR